MSDNKEQRTYLSRWKIEKYFSEVNKHSGAIFPGENESPQLYKSFGCVQERNAKGSIICNEDCESCTKPVLILAEVNDVAEEAGFRLIESNNGHSAQFASIEGFHPSVDYRVNSGPGNSHRRTEFISTPAVALPRNR